MKIYIVSRDDSWREADHYRQAYEVEGIFTNKKDAEQCAHNKNKENGVEINEIDGKLVYRVEGWEAI